MDMGEPEATLLAVLAFLHVKHYAADCLLQTPWMLRGKASLLAPGGYVHAGLHALGSLPAYVLAGSTPGLIALLAGLEFAVHYAIDLGKANASARWPSGPDTRRYWAMHGADQLFHALTYIALTGVMAAVQG